jgi:hypothetical protein
VETKPAYGIEELAKAGPLRRTYLFKAIKEKRLIAQKAGRRTIITHENFQAFLRSLPVVGEQGKAECAGGADLGGFIVAALEERLQTTDRVIRKLIAGGHLKTVTVIHPEEVERFEAEFVSLFVLAKQQGRHFRAVRKELEAVGVKPAMDLEEIGATFYRRAALAGK